MQKDHDGVGMARRGGVAELYLAKTGCPLRDLDLGSDWEIGGFGGAVAGSPKSEVAMPRVMEDPGMSAAQAVVVQKPFECE